MSGSSSPTVVFAGAATLDAIALVDRFPSADQRVIARDVVHAGGGPAATAAVAAARLGVPAAVVTTVGADDEGRRILAGLEVEGVDVSGVQVVPGERSGASVVVVDADQGTRAICTRPVPPLRIPADGPAAGLLDAAAWIHVDHLGWAAVRAWLRSQAGDDRPALSVDAGNPVPGFRPEGVDLYVPTVEALVREHGEQPIDQLLASALRAGAGTVVATNGSKGSFAATPDGALIEVPGHPVDVVSTLGAGDVFHGALLAALVHGLPLHDRLRYANVAAALSCRGLDGRSAVPRHDEVSALLRSTGTLPTPTVPS